MGSYLCIASNDVPPAVSKRVTLHVNCEYNCRGVLFLSLSLLTFRLCRFPLFFRPIIYAPLRTRLVWRGSRFSSYFHFAPNAYTYSSGREKTLIAIAPSPPLVPGNIVRGRICLIYSNLQIMAMEWKKPGTVGLGEINISISNFHSRLATRSFIIRKHLRTYCDLCQQWRTIFLKAQFTGQTRSRTEKQVRVI